MSTQFRRFIAGQPVSLTEVLSQAVRYGELDGEIVYNIATNFAAVSRTLTSAQRAEFAALRTAILNGFPLIPEPHAYRYSDEIAMPAITNTDFLFLPGSVVTLTRKVYLPLVMKASSTNTENFTLTSPTVDAGGALPAEYTCDGISATLALNWSGAPAGTQNYAVIMHHVASPEDVHWYWVLYNLPATVTGLAKNSTGIGTLGINGVNGRNEYAPPCSKGPGDKVYTYTGYALSAQPQFSVPASQINRAVLLEAIQDITLASAELPVTYARK
jgi:phosphatidylethanolamine-binding protein (PEBP) family uncharacterized protein